MFQRSVQQPLFAFPHCPVLQSVASHTVCLLPLCRSARHIHRLDADRVQQADSAADRLGVPLRCLHACVHAARASAAGQQAGHGGAGAGRRGDPRRAARPARDRDRAGRESGTDGTELDVSQGQTGLG